jgi:hypothetical protein
MNRGRYSKTFLQIVDIIAAFFTDELVNKLYYKARNSAAETGTTITDEYKRIVTQYAYGVTNRPDLCKKVILSLHEYYSKFTRFTSIIYVDFEDDILTQFIPPEYYSDFTSKQKTAMMGAIVVSAVQSAIAYVHKPEILEQIIDFRNKSIGRRMETDVDFTLSIQNHIVDVLMSKRDEFYCDFAKKISEKSQKVSVELHQKLRDELKNQVERRCIAERERDKAMKMIFQLVEKIKALNVQLASAATVKPTYTEHQQRLSAAYGAQSAPKYPAENRLGPQSAPKEELKTQQTDSRDQKTDNIDNGNDEDNGEDDGENDGIENYYNISLDDFVNE